MLCHMIYQLVFSEDEVTELVASWEPNNKHCGANYDNCLSGCNVLVACCIFHGVTLGKKKHQVDQVYSIQLTHTSG